ncbi:MAG: HAMP domain-containing histidine kinase [Acidobacteria bacterium]|nr:HAMP domain-containing histidine kinase [Acidobacteriota bacterium]
MLWFFLNLLVLGGVFLALINLDFRFDRNSFFFAPNSRLDYLARLITNETQDKTRDERDAILRRYAEYYRVTLYIFDDDAKQIGGPPVALPPEIAEKIVRNKMPAPVRDGDGRPAEPKMMRPPAPFFYTKTADPPLYWSSSPVFVFDRDLPDPVRARLVAASDSFTGNGLFFNPWPWLLTIGVVVAVSTAVWFPFVRGLTRNIAEMNDAAEKIADEDFSARVSERRSDELGHLGASINHLAQRLEGFVGGQKRFLGDVSHELNSPLARMQFALSILEDRVDEKNRGYVEDVREEVELMSKLVKELLTYSKAGIKAPQIELERTVLRPLVERVAEREKGAEAVAVEISIDPATEVLAQPEMLARAIANVVRNSVRHAGREGSIEISAVDGNEVELKIRDRGAGVPDDALEKIFDPFYRLETHRSRATGGTGLGLAIVKTCVEACQGKVTAQNHKDGGLEITIRLKK